MTRSSQITTNVQFKHGYKTNEIFKTIATLKNNNEYKITKIFQLIENFEI